MQFSVVALAAFAATAAAWSNGTAYTTEIVDVYTTVCPAATSFSINGQTYTVTESTTLTITNCPCTVVKPVTTTSAVVATTAPVYVNSTTTAAATKSVGTTSVKSAPTTTPSTITASGAEKAFALSGASLAGLLGLAAYLL